MPSMGVWASVSEDIVIGPLRTDSSMSLGKCPRSTYFRASLFWNRYPTLVNLDIIPHNSPLERAFWTGPIIIFVLIIRSLEDRCDVSILSLYFLRNLRSCFCLW